MKTLRRYRGVKVHVKSARKQERVSQSGGVLMFMQGETCLSESLWSEVEMPQDSASDAEANDTPGWQE